MLCGGPHPQVLVNIVAIVFSLIPKKPSVFLLHTKLLPIQAGVLLATVSTEYVTFISFSSSSSSTADKGTTNNLII